MILFFTCITLLYLILFVWLRNGVAVIDEPFSDKDEDNIALPSVSVLVAARNEEKNISDLLSQLLRQNYPKDRLEIIIANDDSSDRTADIVEAFARKDRWIKQLLVTDLPADWSPKMWALSKAIRESKGQILLFTDADCKVGPDWIVNMVLYFRDHEVGMVIGPSPLRKRAGLWQCMLAMESLGQDALAAGGLARGIPLIASGRNLAIRRSTYDAVNGFEEIKSFFGGDDDLMMHKSKASGWAAKFCAHPAADAMSGSPPNFNEFLKQRLRFASKGKSYFNLPFVSGSFKWILTLIYLTNVGVLVGQIAFLTTFDSTWLLPWFLKMLGDGILVAAYTSLVERYFNPGIFLLDELWHSFYVVLFGILGSFLPISWKGRRKSSRIV